ncbi:MAG: glycosyl hydrolase family 53 [Lachnospiraceae bacterium]|nr:glycosyl hydrolase family 53 [Lachnospiraceae bacterium]
MFEIKGYSFGYMGRCGDYLKESTIDSLDKMLATGVDYVSLCVVEHINTVKDTEINFHFGSSLDDYEVEKMIETIHSKGAKVCLKPMINVRDGSWRALIDFGTDSASWEKWFFSYTRFMLHYAKIAERTGTEMLCLGCEMLGMEKEESNWRLLIASVRGVYNGLLIYNTNHDKELVANWYDEIDYIGTSAYYRVAKRPNATLEEMKEGWKKSADMLDKVWEKWHKKIVFMEIGCRSAAGCAMMPWDYTHPDLPLSEEEQARFFEASFEVMQEKDWFAGYFWWDWSHRLHTLESAKNDRGFGIYGKKAEEVVRKYYKN